jgi:hypothetical protein
MKITGLDDKIYNWNPTANQADTSNRSGLHKKAKELLDEMFPHDRILEEVSIPGTKNMHRKSTLRADFFIPNRNLMIEVHGEQHHKFNPFFFKNKLAFYKAQARDRDKKEWCEINSIRLIEFNYNEDIDEWRRKI